MGNGLMIHLYSNRKQRSLDYTGCSKLHSFYLQLSEHPVYLLDRILTTTHN